MRVNSREILICNCIHNQARTVIHQICYGITVRAEIITELILKRAVPVIFKTFLLEIIAFRPIPVICPARGVKPENYWKR